MKTFRILFLGLLTFSPMTSAQDYPYDEPPPAKSGTGNKSGGSSTSDDDLPVESPDELVKGGKFKKRTSIFRMALKGGGNFALSQDSSSGLSYTGFGFDGRVAFGWDMAFQPIYLETGFGYRGINLTTVIPAHVILFQQGLYYRERIGKTAMWKPGVLSGLDLRIYKVGVGYESSLFPVVGVTSLWEFGPALFQISAYIHRIGTNNSFLSGAVLGGLKF